MDLNSLDNFDKSPMVASVLGSVIGLKFVPGGSGFSKFVNFVGGVSTAVFGVQVLAWFLNISHVGVIAGLAFLLGLLSMVVLDEVVKGLRETRLGDALNGALMRFRPSGSTSAQPAKKEVDGHGPR